MDYAKLEDNVETTPRLIAPEIGAMLGAWVNTNPASRGIVRLRLSAADGRLTIRAVAAGDVPAEDWGDIPADAVYGDRLDTSTVIGFTARRDFGGMESHLHANVSLGLLIVAAFHLFTDGSGRASFYAREFYRRTDAS